MDPDEDNIAKSASARKRQKRHDSGDEDESSSSRSAAGDATMDMEASTALICEEKTAVISETEIGTYSSTNTSKTNYNNDVDDDDDSNKEGGMSSKQILLQGEEAEGNDESMSPPEEEDEKISLVQGALSPAAASAVLASDIVPNTSDTIDSDDDPSDVEVNPETSNADTSPTFNQRNIPSTRSYRRITVELVATLESSSDSEAAVAPVLPSVEEEPEETAEAVVPNPNDEPTSSDGDSNSRMEDDFWNHYDSSTSNTSSDGGMADHSDWIEPEPNAADRENIDFAVNEIMYKDKPPYTWNSAHELMQREHNIINRIGWRGGHTSVDSFGRGFYGSRHVVEQMSLWNAMIKHKGCVNCLNFNRAGDLLCSGSDDTRIIVWDWANNKPLHIFKSGHHANIFQTKFIDSSGCLDIVSTSRDGQVRRAVIPPSGGDTKPTRLYAHTDAVHKIVVVPHTKHEVMSAGEDGTVKHFDLRTSTSANTMLHCTHNDHNRRGQRSRVRLFSISHHPFAPEFCVSGADDNLRVYDKRKLPSPIHEMTPRGVRETKMTHITCAVYNHSGSEILASYSDAGIFLYDSRNYKEGDTLHCYEGHVNHRTIKGVNFFGPRSEYVISGSDCGHIFFWDRNTESIINYMKGDIAGVINCLEPHPWMPVLATSGLEHNVKIWTPDVPGKHVPKPEGLRDTLYSNFRRSILETVGDDNASQQFQIFFRQVMGDPSTRARWRVRRYSRRNEGAADAPPGSVPQHEQSFSSATSSASDTSSMYRRRDSNSSDTSGEGYPRTDPMGCNTQ
ncbi:DDB1- and CUL4-associated factor 8 [Drosophila miranda]|uniref:DDB1- and CUL4-associated factor 8 n=1 Tax=Drosophila miranda TaxID=7229 RepID=UPI0007E74C28|nr:DDB1- and CUL4-associated factor 8 [Drosophila miranda]